MSSQDKKIEEIYYTALDKKSTAERSAYLDKVCGNNKTLRSRVNSLLEAHYKAVGFLEVPILDEQTTLSDSVLTEGPGTAIGRYKLLEKIGEGGMAVVYRAEQAEPIRRKVALKIIKLGMDTKSVITRFEAERQALALGASPRTEMAWRFSSVRLIWGHTSLTLVTFRSLLSVLLPRMYWR